MACNHHDTQICIIKSTNVIDDFQLEYTKPIIEIYDVGIPMECVTVSYFYKVNIEIK